jgi:hypothetical protein
VRNQPGHFLPTILKTGIDRSGLIRLPYGEYRAALNKEVRLAPFTFKKNSPSFTKLNPTSGMVPQSGTLYGYFQNTEYQE